MAQSIDVAAVINISKEAGQEILKIYHDSNFSQVVDYKADDSPLTMADKASHAVIASSLEKLTPQ